LPKVSVLRKRRIARVQALKSQGLSSAEIGRRLKLAPSTVRDYSNDPLRKRARHRQRKYPVRGVHMPAGGTAIEAVKANWKRGGPAGEPGLADATLRGRQMRAVIGYYARR
jgi:hypothetical protein